jgi:hypothetical protein
METVHESPASKGRRMKIFFKILAGALLIFNGMSALYGGLNLVVYPNGNSLGLPLDWLEHSPFENYFIPGLILFTLIGLSSLFICVAILLDSKKYALLILIQGTILAAWIVVQIIMIRFESYLQLVYGLVALLLIVCGRILIKPIHSGLGERKKGMRIA